MFMYSIIEFIVELFKIKDPKDSANNDSIEEWYKNSRITGLFLYGNV
jgi:hypothetical protein